jgi:hypothetical protein
MAAKSQVIIGVGADVKLGDLDRGIAKLQQLRAEVNQGSPAFKVLGENVDGFTSKISHNFTEALTGVGAALAGAFAVEKVGEFFKSTIEAAMEDEKALRSLAITMRNVGDSTPIKEVTEFVDKLAEQTGVAKEQLIPAYQKLETVLGDSAKAQTNLKLAMDISAGTGKDLESVTAALAKGFAGSTTALSRLGAGIDKSILATGDMAQITAVLSQKFEGQAAAAADTFSGRLNRISVASNQAKEDIGYALLNSIDQLSQAFGGADGITGQIDLFGKSVANTINGVNFLTKYVTTLGTSATNASGGIGFFTEKLKTLADLLKGTVNGLQTLGNIMQVLQLFGAANAAKTQMQADEYHGAYTAISAYNKGANAAIGTVDGLTNALDDNSAAAANNAASLAAANAQAFARFADRGSPTAIEHSMASFALTPAELKAANDRDAALAASLARAKGGGSSAKAASDIVKMVAIDYAKAAADINKSLNGLSVSISGGGEKVTQALADEFKSRTDAFKAAITEQQNIIKSAQDAIASYSDQVSGTVFGSLAKSFKDTFSATVKDAAGNDVNAGPEAIVNFMLGDIAAQQKAVSRVAAIALKLPGALTQQILGLDAGPAFALADYLANNPDLTQRLTDNYNALADQTKTLLGDPMAQAFATVGGQSAVALIAGAKDAIAAASSEFQAWAANALQVTISISSDSATTAGQAAGSQLSAALSAQLASMAPSLGSLAAAGGFMGLLNPLAGRASGGSVTGGTPYMVGENGPEVFVPGIDGAIIPNGGMAGGSSSSGNTYAITVNSGVGDPRQIGQDIVQYIRQFEQSSGRVFAKA